MGGRHRWAITAVAVAIVVIAAAFIATRPTWSEIPPSWAFVDKNVTEDSVDLTLVVPSTMSVSELSVQLTDENDGLSARANLKSAGELRLTDERSFLLTYHDLVGDDRAANGDSIRITGPFSPGNYSVTLITIPGGYPICKTAFDVT